MSRELLAQSANYKLFGNYEEAQLEGNNFTGYKTMGDFYGNVDCACIDWNEKWVVLGGNGIIIYNLREPFEEFRYDYKTSQWQELWRQNDTHWYPEVIYQIDEQTVRIVIDLFSDIAGIYDLNVETLKYEKKL